MKILFIFGNDEVDKHFGSWSDFFVELLSLDVTLDKPSNREFVPLGWKGKRMDSMNVR